MRESKKSEGEAFKAPPPPDRIGLKAQQFLKKSLDVTLNLNDYYHKALNHKDYAELE